MEQTKGHRAFCIGLSILIALLVWFYANDDTEIEISVKYEGYIKRQLQQVAEFKRVEGHKLPPDLDYNAIQGLRLEAREKLSAVRPMDLGQASRISGVSPADLTALMIWLENKR